MEIFEISTEVLTYMPGIFGMGMACSCFVVLTAGLLVGCFKTFTKMIGGR